LCLLCIEEGADIVFVDKEGSRINQKTSGKTREAKITKLNGAEEIVESWWCKLSELSQSQFSE
jgi:hypothetical protein